jgi:hypothetical protein
MSPQIDGDNTGGLVVRDGIAADGVVVGTHHHGHSDVPIRQRSPLHIKADIVAGDNRIDRCVIDATRTEIGSGTE